MAAATQPPKRVCLSLVAKDREAPLAWGGELILAAGKPVGEVTSAAFGATLDRVVMLGYVDTHGEAVDNSWLSARVYEVDIAGERVPVTASLSAPFDLEHARLRA